MANQTIYTPGGTVQVGNGVYIRRQADDQLLQLCQAGEYAYVLTSRQMGKSSLMIATARRLRAAGTISISVDLTDIGKEGVTPANWYLGFLLEIEAKLEEQDQRLTTDVYDWWQQQQHLSITQRFTLFFREVLLAELTQPVVIFVDEIDTTLTLDFTDDFFIALRSFYTNRTEFEVLKRLSFVLIGVATPNRLIADTRRTPFNIGQRVDLTDFTPIEAAPLAAGLGVEPAAEQRLFTDVLRWTDGHPYLTQRLCIELSRLPEAERPRADVDELVAQIFLGEQQDQDAHLKFVQDMMLERAPDRQILEVLKAYREIYTEKERVYDEDQSVVKAHLKLAGVVKRMGSVLQVRNPIYREVFGRQWIQEQWPENWWQRNKPVLKWAIPVTASSLAVAGVMFGLYEDARLQETIAIHLAELAEEKAQEAEQERKRADEERKHAQENETLARNRLQEVETANKIAEAERQQAVLAQQAEAEQRQRAEEQRRAAEIAQQAETEQRLIAEQETAKAERQQAIAEEKTFVNEINAESFKTDTLRLSNLNIEALVNGIETARQVVNHKNPPQNIKMRPAVALNQVIHSIRERNRLEDHTDWVGDVSFSPDGQTLASASNDRTVKLWQRDGTLIDTLEGHTDWVLAVSFSPVRVTTPQGLDYILASAGADGTVRLWQLDGTLMDTLEGHAGWWRNRFRGWIRDVSFSPDGKTIATANDDGTVRLWQLDGTLMETLEGHTYGVNTISFSPDGEILASAGADGMVRLWQRDGTPIATLESPGNLVFAVSFSPDGKTIATASDDGTVRLWQRNGTPITTLEGHMDWVRDVSFSPNGKTIATASDDGTVRLWQLDGMTSISIDGMTSIIIEGENPIAQRDKLTPIATLEGHRGNVSAVSFSPDGQILASTSNDGTVRLWRDGIPIISFERTPHGTSAMSFSSHGLIFASASNDGTVQLWQHDGALINTFKGYTDSVSAVNFSPDGQILAIASNDGTVRLWQHDGALINTLEGHTDSVSAVNFSPDGQILAIASNDGTVRLWQYDGALINTLEGHTDNVSAMGFSPDGQILAIASNDGTVRLWQHDGVPINTLKGHRGSVLAVSFSPNGQTLASVGNDGTVRLWQRDGDPIAILEGHRDSVLAVSFSPNGQTLASYGADGTVQLWNFNLTELVNQGCEWLRDYIVSNGSQEEKALCPEQSGVSPTASPATQPAHGSWLTRPRTLFAYLFPNR